MEEFWKMQWPVSVFLSILSVCFISVIIISIYFKHKKEIKKDGFTYEKELKQAERQYIQSREERMHEWASEKIKENLEKEIDSLKKKQEQLQKEKELLDLNRIAFLMYMLTDRKDSSFNMEKLSKEIESFKSIYKEFEKYLKTNQ